MDWPALRPDQIVAKAREFIGTPWHHDARRKGKGIDCIGLVACTFAELGVPIQDQRGYGLGDQFQTMRAAVEAHGDPVGLPSPDGMEFGYVPALGAWTLRGVFPSGEYGDRILHGGDVLLFRNLKLPPALRIENHAGVYDGQGGMIHAWNASAVRAVVEHPLDAFWLRSIAAIYRYKGVQL